MRGKIIVFEGIDGSGKKTQTEKIYEYLASKDINCKILSFPFYHETFFGKEVAKYLNGKFGNLNEVHPKLAAILYAGDRFEKKDYITKELEKGTLLICDRYVPSNIAHHASKLLPSEQPSFKEWVELLEYQVFKLPRPDHVIFLDMPPHISKRLVLHKGQRGYTSKKQDLHEENQDYLIKVYDVFNFLSQDNKWITIKCYENNSPATVEKIHNKIIKEIKKIFKNTSLSRKLI